MPPFAPFYPQPLQPSTAVQALALAAAQQAKEVPGAQHGAGQHWGLIPAAGLGSRAGLGLPKQYAVLPSHQLPLLVVSVQALAQAPGLSGIVVVVSAQDELYEQCKVGRILESLNLPVPVLPVACGGATRGLSVLAGAGLFVQAGLPETVLWVHDAARPNLAQHSLVALRQALEHPREQPAVAPSGATHIQSREKAVVLALPVVDTLHHTDPDRPAPKRDGLWSAQTPQLASAGALTKALQQMPEATDEATALRAMGLALEFVAGSIGNRKLTLPSDFASGNDMPSSSPMPPPPVRVGTGFDVHALVLGRRLVLGGVTIEHTHGLLGHSDADVLLHAIADAILGAAGLGDIGRHFPDTDPTYAGADSRALLRSVVERVAAQGLAVAQVDATVIAQAPKLAPHIAQMVANIQADLATPWVNVKATTTERLGFAGRGEGIAAEAVAVLVPNAGF